MVKKICLQFQPKIPSRNSTYPKHFFTQHYEKHDQSHVLKTQQTEQANYQMSLSTFQCMSFCFTMIYSCQKPSSQLFHHLEQTKKNKLENLTNSPKNRTEPLKNRNHHTVVTISENLPLSNAEKSVLSKGLNFVPISKKSDEFTTRQDVEKFLRRVQLKAFFQNKEDKSDNTEKDAFQTLTAKKSKWTPPEGQFASIDYFIKKCRHDVHKLKSNCNTKLSNLSKEEWTALINLKNRNDLVIKAAEKGGQLFGALTSTNKKQKPKSTKT